VTYKALKADPLADFSLYQKSFLDKALAAALKHQPVEVESDVLGKKGHLKI